VLEEEGYNSEEFALKEPLSHYLPSTTFFGLRLFLDYLNKKHDI
jgi:hypothetical protein